MMKTFQDFFFQIMDFSGNQTVQGPNTEKYYYIKNHLQ